MASNNVQHCKSTAPAVEWRCISPSDVSQDSNSEVIMEVDLTGQVIDLTGNSDTEGDDDDVIFVEEIRKSSSKVRALRDFRPSSITPEPIELIDLTEEDEDMPAKLMEASVDVDDLVDPLVDPLALNAFVSDAINCTDFDQFMLHLGQLPYDH